MCALPECVLKDMVSYALWCLQGAQQSGLQQATMFFSASFCFRPLLQLFDRQDGLRHLVNLVSRNTTVSHCPLIGLSTLEGGISHMLGDRWNASLVYWFICTNDTKAKRRKADEGGVFDCPLWWPCRSAPWTATSHN